MSHMCHVGVSTFVLSPSLPLQSHAPHLACPKVFGKVQEGIYIQAGDAGVFEVEEREEKGFVEETEEHDGQGPFAQEALVKRREALLGSMNAGSKAREQAAVEAPKAATLEDVMAFLRPRAPLAGPDKKEEEDSDGKEVCDVDSSESSEGSDSSSDHSDHKARVRNFFGGPKLAGPSIGAASKNPEDLKQTRSGKGSSKISSSKPAQKAQTSKKAEQPKTEVTQETGNKIQDATGGAVATGALTSTTGIAMFDKRSMRMKSTLDEKVAELQVQIANIDFTEPIQKQSREARLEYKQMCTKRARKLQYIVSEAKEFRRRIKNSSNTAAYAVEEDTLTEICDTASQMLALNAMLQPGNVELSKYFDCVEALDARRKPGMLGPAVWQRAFSIRVASAIIYETWESLLAPALQRDGKEDSWGG